MGRGILLLNSIALLAIAQDADAQKILDRFESIRPADKELALYRLDWTPGLKDAKERAAKEGRPIFLIVVTNSYGDMVSGHC
ncbi:MAG TPA: hypothetical protein VI643_01555 [Planctomycetota bacterium]|nr:hypothetical protein [Planctomycetota bacterium]